MRLSLNPFRAVIFDMDGLLLDTERLCLEHFAQAAQEQNLAWSATVAQQLIGRNAHDGDTILRQTFGDDYPVEALRERFNALTEASVAADKVVLKPFVRELLERLAARNIPCAIATSSRRVRAELKLRHCKLIPYFKAVVCGDEVTRGKPHPEIFEAAARQLGIEPRYCLVLG